MQQEVFGPVLVMQVFDTEAEAVRLADDSEYGLAASVWSLDADSPLRVARHAVRDDLDQLPGQAFTTSSKKATSSRADRVVCAGWQDWMIFLNTNISPSSQGR